MELTVREINGVNVIDIQGELMASTKAKLKGAMMDLFAEDNFNLILNFKDVYIIDSSGIGLLVSALQQVRERGGDIKILNLSGFSKRTFKVTGLNTVFHLFSSEEKAVESFHIKDQF